MDNSIIITDSCNKKRVIKYLSSLNKVVNTRIMTSKELLDNYYYTYDEETIYYVMTKYHVKYDIALIYLNNLYYVDKKYNNKKIDLLLKIKKDLDSQHLLDKNNLFKDYLKNKKIIIYNMDYIPNIIKKIVNDYIVICDEDKGNINSIYVFKTIDDEISFVAAKIVELIKKGIDINKIYLTNLNDEYRLLIKRIFKFFNIAITLDDVYDIYGTNIVQRFIELYDKDISKTLDTLKKNLSDKEVDIYNMLINICNNYTWCDNYLDVKELIIHDIKNSKIKSILKTNSVREIKFGEIPNEDEYVFLLGFNQGSIPIIYKDEDYLSDKEKEILDIETSYLNNLNEKDHTIKTIKRYNNLIISYKEKTLTDTYTISNINEELKYPIINDYNIEYTHSNLYNKLLLGSSLDLFNNYGTITPNLTYLHNHYKDIKYRVYDNKFTGIDTSLLNKYLDNKLLLSYSSLDNYNRCAFRYYVGNILKLNIYEETFMQLIGNLFHYVLSNAFKEDFDYDTCFDNYITKELSNKEKFFIKKLKEDLRFIIDTIKEHNSHTSLDEELYEEKVYVNLDGNINVTFMGIIDKLKYKQIGDKFVVAIIDYKTGNPNLKLNNAIYGIEMQLPIYIFLAKHHPKFNNIEVAGFYLQKILHNEIKADHKHSYLELKKDNLLLQGYSNQNENIISAFDDSYTDSKVIKGLKMSSKGFYAYSKVLSNDEINALEALVEDKIKESAKKITNGEFTINPKRVGDDNLGCEFCSFKDICFHTEKDIVNLKEYKDLSFLGGEDHA